RARRRAHRRPRRRMGMALGVPHQRADRAGRDRLGQGLAAKSAWFGSGAEPDPRDRHRADFDPVGLVLLAFGTLLIMLPFLERSAGAWIYALVPAGAAIVFGWVKWENRYARRGGSPMVDMQMFRTRSFAYGASLTSIYFVGMPGVWVI